MRIFAFCFLALLNVGCGIYKSEWDCPPGEGVRCKSVSDVIDLIVEKEEGQDLFVTNKYEADSLRNNIKHPVVNENRTLYLMKKPSGDAVMVEGKS